MALRDSLLMASGRLCLRQEYLTSTLFPAPARGAGGGGGPAPSAAGRAAPAPQCLLPRPGLAGCSRPRNRCRGGGRWNPPLAQRANVFPASKAQLKRVRGARAAQSEALVLGAAGKEHRICTRVYRGRRRPAMFRCGLSREEADSPAIVTGPGRAAPTPCTRAPAAWEGLHRQTRGEGCWQPVLFSSSP